MKREAKERKREKKKEKKKGGEQKKKNSEKDAKLTDRTRTPDLCLKSPNAITVPQSHPFTRQNPDGGYKNP